MSSPPISGTSPRRESSPAAEMTRRSTCGRLSAHSSRGVSSPLAAGWTHGGSRAEGSHCRSTGRWARVLGGLSRREYERCAGAVSEAFGLSASTVSRRFKRASARELRELMERRLDGYDLVALLRDGKTFAEDEMVAAVGVT